MRNTEYSSELSALNKIHLAAIIVVLTGRRLIGVHTISLQILSDTDGLVFMEESEVEITQQSLLHCSAIVRLWLNHIGSDILAKSGE